GWCPSCGIASVAVCLHRSVPVSRSKLSTWKRWKWVGGRVFVSKRGSGLGSSSGLALRSVSGAVTRKTWSPQTIGVALPAPGKSAFHLMLVAVSHLTGGFAPAGATLFAVGPRQLGQLPVAVSG